MKHLFHVIDVDMTLTIFLRLNVVTSGDISEPSAMVIYIIKIGRFVCGQRCDWSARGPVTVFKPKTSVASFRLVILIWLNCVKVCDCYSYQ